MGKVGNTQMVRLADYVSPSKAADLVGCTKGRIYQMLRGGEFRDLIPVGKRSVLIGRKEVEKIANNPSATGRPRKKLAG
jgi:hypothetical protein